MCRSLVTIGEFPNSVLGVDVFFWVLSGCLIVLLILVLILRSKPSKAKPWEMGSMS